MADFLSDTSAPAHAHVLRALESANALGNVRSYGDDALTHEVGVLLERVFGTSSLKFWLVACGTAANALALSSLCSPLEAILCHPQAHIYCDERNAVEFYTGGARLTPLHGCPPEAVSAEVLRRHLALVDRTFVHEAPPRVLSLSMLGENGTCYTKAQLRELCAIASQNGLFVHIDGARIANALAQPENGWSSAAELVDAGVDVLTLGLTKTGAMGCEIIVLFNEACSRFPDLRARAKRAGLMPPKMRYLAAQAVAMLENDLWLDLAAQANRMAADLVAATVTIGPETSSRVGLEVDLAFGRSATGLPAGNEVFLRMPVRLGDFLRNCIPRILFYPWQAGDIALTPQSKPDLGEPLACYRFVCSWSTRADEVQYLCEKVEEWRKLC
ncbi:Low specificity L-threonine aldolase [Porphyridium purpureum]|uniref:Low specificity L-threonine aldolase n=1 Tax=Porphyridium purpureum TaxID=35688 RepID=A0A5J4Z4V0_PORPP|nr:Low specificity L-threonine aldolase [Porphyridium purpureum]|eukprot:POR7514..scf295_1